MTDETERRLRESLRGADLPGAPETLRASMREIPSSPVPASARRSWMRSAWAVPALAAVVVVAVIAGALSGGSGRIGAAVSSASPSALASAAPSGQSALPATSVPSSAAPPTSISVLDAAGLRTELDAIKAGTVAAHDVVADVSVDPSQVPSPRTVECQQPLGTCTVIGVVAGTSQAVTVRSQYGVLQPPTAGGGLDTPLALRLVPGGPIELLGHVDLANGSAPLDTAGLKSQTDSATPGHLVAVRAWLSGINGMSCGPMQPSDVPAPFTCRGDPSFLNDQPVAGATIDDHPSAAPGSSMTPTRVITGSIPDSAVPVQAFAYGSYAPSPATPDGINDAPRQGLYLVRMVAVDNADCPKCRGWLMVGRLDARPPAADPSAQPNAGERVYSTPELAVLLEGDRAAFVGKAVFVDGTITGWPGSCASADPRNADQCSVGTLDGTTEPVVASRYTTRLVGADASLPPNGQMAFRVLATGLEYLGSMGFGGAGVDFQAPVSQLAGDFSNNQPLLTFIVSGWLGWSGALPCPSQPGSPPPADTPFGKCPYAWLAATAAAPGTSSPPADSVPVQWQAYQDFAPSGTLGSTQARYGTYLVRLVVDTRQGINGPRGWQVVARLAP
jgi:hypothetical protein